LPIVFARGNWDAAAIVGQFLIHRFTLPIPFFATTPPSESRAESRPPRDSAVRARGRSALSPLSALWDDSRMLSDPPQVAHPRPREPGTETVRAKVRIRFRKGGDLRLVSHRDLMTCFERMLRRADLPFHSTQGFHPKPRLVFALSLALGIVGSDEVVELELDADLAPEEIHARLARQAPPGLEIRSVRAIAPRARARVESVTYRVDVPPERQPELPARMAALRAAPECWIERTRPHQRRINLRPYLRDLRLGADALEMDLWVTPTGAARPEEILAVLGLADLPAAGAILERTHLELTDENPPTGEHPSVPAGIQGKRLKGQEGPGVQPGEGPVSSPVVPFPLSSVAPLTPPADGGQGTEVDGQPRSTPLIPGPLTFDS
jgi:radical SAM-linked protein